MKSNLPKINSLIVFFVLQPCTECSPPMLLSNSCSSAAHKRIHRSCKPHICPECGCSVEQLLFQTHLDETCLHFARRIGYRCDVSPRGHLFSKTEVYISVTSPDIPLSFALTDVPVASWCSEDSTP